MDIIYLLVLLVAFLIGCMSGVVYTTRAFTKNDGLTERVTDLESIKPNVRDYAEQLKKIDLLMEYLDVVEERPKPFLRKKK